MFLGLNKPILQELCTALDDVAKALQKYERSQWLGCGIKKYGINSDTYKDACFLGKSTKPHEYNEKIHVLVFYPQTYPQETGMLSSLHSALCHGSQVRESRTRDVEMCNKE